MNILISCLRNVTAEPELHRRQIRREDVNWFKLVRNSVNGLFGISGIQVPYFIALHW
jgi:hypothetical protein